MYIYIYICICVYVYTYICDMLVETPKTTTLMFECIFSKIREVHFVQTNCNLIKKNSTKDLLSNFEMLHLDFNSLGKGIHSWFHVKSHVFLFD